VPIVISAAPAPPGDGGLTDQPAGSGGSQGGSSSGGGGGGGNFGSPSQNPPGGAPAQTPASLTVGLPKKLSLKALRRAFALTVRANGALSGLVAKLASAKKPKLVLATGKLASLTGSAQLKLKLPKKLKPGPYVLTFAASSATGRIKKTVSFTLKR
jgi:hypothetical protein